MTKPKTTPGAVRETDEFLSDDATPGAQGSSGGRLAREVGTQDEEKAAEEDLPGVTGVTKSDEQKSDPKSVAR